MSKRGNFKLRSFFNQLNLDLQSAEVDKKQTSVLESKVFFGAVVGGFIAACGYFYYLYTRPVIVKVKKVKHKERKKKHRKRLSENSFDELDDVNPRKSKR